MIAVNDSVGVTQSVYDQHIRPTNTFVQFKRESLQQSVPSRFEEIAIKYANRAAINSADSTLAYDSLNRMANRIARALLVRADKGNKPVAVVVENDVATMTAILGVLKAGKIYLPVDVSYSLAWVNSILDETHPQVILATQRTLETARRWQRPGQELIQIDALDASLSDDNPAVKIPPDAFAYLLYTSGSTARPKGVVDTHRNLLHYVMRLTNASHVSAEDRMTLVRPPSSSGALMNFFLALLNGSELYPISIRSIGVGGLARWLQQEEITIFHCGVTVFRNFAQMLTGDERFPRLRLIRLSSGQVSKLEVDLFRRHFPDAILLHVLSSTEANTYRMHFLSSKSEMRDPVLPVGFPVEDMEVVILDDGGCELGAGQAGEIAIRSEFLFPGYWNNSALTAAAFAPDSQGGPQRLFRTGDLGRIRPDGSLDYLGRKDFRLKIRGHSIQAEEVELALMELPEIEHAAVVSRKDRHGDDRLVAYITPEPAVHPSVTDLRQKLSRRLPEFMIPSTFVICHKMPLNPNGKIDRQALPTPVRVRPLLQEAFIAPKSATERVVAKAWTSILEIEGIGTKDNFFDLGGDSLLASRIVASLSRVYPWEISVAELIQSPTVTEIAEILTSKEASTGQAEQISGIFLDLEVLSPQDLDARVQEERKRRSLA